ncbi:hypothetical protein BC936DRAFT_136666 [Jimgerdemannia flammicorona]|uniref:Uncharacterized protein n=1 Tax=Jimgerdemannia flammicorona TaxID=994334 RepID=A0A433CZ22_9FUNG|nr:hypothetical protein BC936DRAFT_136666 [Jimgerdemannia flammicorona]
MVNTFKIAGFRFVVKDKYSKETFGSTDYLNFDESKSHPLMDGYTWHSNQLAYGYLSASIASPAEGAGICGGFTEVWSSDSTKYIGTRDKWGTENGVNKTIASFYDVDMNFCHIKVYHANELPLPICALFEDYQIKYGEADKMDGRLTVAQIRSWRNDDFKKTMFLIKEDEVTKVEVIKVVFDEIPLNSGPRPNDGLRPRVMETKEFINETDVEQTQNIVRTQTVTKTVTIRHAWSLKVGVGLEVTAKAEVPLIGGGSATASFNLELGYSGHHETSKSETHTLSVNNPVTIPAKSKIRCTIILMEGQVECTGKATFRVHYKNGDPVEVTSSITYGNVDGLELHVKWENM